MWIAWDFSIFMQSKFGSFIWSFYCNCHVTPVISSFLIVISLLIFLNRHSTLSWFKANPNRWRWIITKTITISSFRYSTYEWMNSNHALRLSPSLLRVCLSISLHAVAAATVNSKPYKIIMSGNEQKSVWRSCDTRTSYICTQSHVAFVSVCVNDLSTAR